MFERFTDGARRVIVLAQEEARLLNHNYIGTEHVLLGLIHEQTGIAARVLAALRISLDGARAQVDAIVGRGGQVPSGHIPFTPRAKKVLELSLREALELGHRHIGTEHILLALAREGEGVAAQVLVGMGADLARVRRAVRASLAEDGREVDGDDELDVGYSTTVMIEPAVEYTGPELMTFGSFPPRAPTSVCAFCGRDLWEVARHVVATHSAICDECLARARRALDTTDARAASMLPRPTGPTPVDDGTLEAIRDAFVAAFDRQDPDAFEDPQHAAALAGLRGRFAMTARVIVEKVRMDVADSADVGFAFRLGPSPTAGAFPFEGQAVLRAGRWKVAAATSAAVCGMAGGQV